MAVTRKPFSASVRVSVLTKCKRRCALCFGLKNDSRTKRGQLAHIDRNGLNIKESNAVFLCTLHHDLYDSTSRQTIGFEPAELREHQETLLAYVVTIKNGKKQNVARNGEPSPSALDVYDRRIPIYRLARQFVRDVAENLRPDLPLIFKFATETDEAMFLFDDQLAEYLETLYKKALRVHTIALLRERMHRYPNEAENFQEILEEHTSLAMWFTEQPQEIRKRFAPFLRLVSKNGTLI